MFYLWATIFTLLNLCWLSLNLFSLPGNWLMLASAGLLAWLYWPAEIFSMWTLAAAAALALAGELIEIFAGLAGAKWAGAAKGAGLAALAGGFIGAIAGTALIPIPFVGTLVGAAIGAGAGAAIVDFSSGKKATSVMRTGVGSGVGRILGTMIKLVLGALIWVILTVAVYWP